MSGIEVAGLFFGVLPIFFEILKAFRQTRKRLETFKRYNQVVDEIQLDFRLEESAFNSECRHLLSAVISDRYELEQMLQQPDANATQWHDRNVSDRLRRLLGHEYGMCEQVVVKIREMMRETIADLESLTKASAVAKVRHAPQHCCPSNNLEESDSTGDILRRLHHAFNVSVKENRYKKILHELNTWNAKFRRLRKQTCVPQNSRHFSSTSVVLRTVPFRYTTVHEASNMLHSSLEDAWSCSNNSHEAHQAKLWLNAHVEYEKVRLSMAISCRQKGTTMSSSNSELPIWLYVQSVATKPNSSKPTQSLPPLTAGLMPPMQVGLQAQTSFEQRKLEMGSVRATLKRCSKRLRSDSETTKTDGLLPPRPEKEIRTAAFQERTDEQSYVMLDLRNTTSFCCHLYGCKSSCLGFLENKDTFKFIFYDAANHAIVGNNQPKNGTELPLTTTLSLLSPLQQLVLAHNLAVAALQYHSTPWLAEDWNLKDLAIFGDNAAPTADELVHELETLHLSTQFPKKSDTEGCGSEGKKPALVAPDLESAEATSSIQATHRHIYGIRNMTLAKLGLAILQIGHKKEIESFQLGQQQHDVIRARILADSKGTLFGERYQRIARKCLDCNFSAEDDLKDESLRNAVYSNVVCELEQMIEDYKRFLGAIG